MAHFSSLLYLNSLQRSLTTQGKYQNHAEQEDQQSQLLPFAWVKDAFLRLQKMDSVRLFFQQQQYFLPE
jgi:hypothetical protein